MYEKTNCPHCGEEKPGGILDPNPRVGQKIRCQSCGGVFEVEWDWAAAAPRPQPSMVPKEDQALFIWGCVGLICGVPVAIWLLWRLWRLVF